MKNNQINVLLIIRHPVGGIKSFIRYVYARDIFKKYKFTIMIPESYMNDALRNKWHDLNPEYIIYNESPTALFAKIFWTLRYNDFELVHSHGFTSLVCTALATFLYRVKHLFTSHDMLLEKQFTGIQGRFKKYLILSALHATTRIHLVSYDAKNNLIDMYSGLDTNKITVIPNGIDTSIFSRTIARDFRRELNISENVFLIGFLGRFMSPKGFRFLVEAIDLLKDDLELNTRPIVITLGYSGFIREDKQLVYDKRLDDFFRFLPPTDKPQEAIRGMDLVVMPSLWEASGLLAMEVLCSGVPLLATSCIGLRETVSESPAIVAKPGNAKSLADNIKCIILSNDIISKFRSYQHIAIERYSVINTATMLEAVYNEIIHN